MSEMTLKQKENQLLGLMNKYQHKQPGELYSCDELSMKKYRLREKIQFVQRNKKDLNLSDNDVERVIYILKSVKDLRLLYRRCKWETIVLAIMVAVKEESTGTLVIFRDYKIIKQYKLKERTYATVISRLWKLERKNKPISEIDYLKGSGNPTMTW
jgi:hypothetical protein